MPEAAFGLCVIGAGAAGLSVAAVAAQLGVKIALVERDRMGGECLNTGCVPSKALVAAARAAHDARTAGRFGIDLALPRVDFAAVTRHVHEVIAAIAPHDSAERFEGLGAEVIHGEARFVGPRLIAAGDRRIRARRIVIATGSEPAVPPFPGLDGVRYFTNETIFDNAEPPRHLLIVGAGPVGLELAQAHRRLGAAVTVIEAARALPKDDPELADALLQALADEGVAIRQQARITAVLPDGAGIALEIAENGRPSRIAGSHLLLAAGRRPRLAALDLDRGGIAHDADGIRVDRRLRTTARGVYAIGDVVAGGPRFTHVGAYHAGIVIRNALFRLPARVDYRALPWVTFTDPELAQIGMGEAAARRRWGDDVRVTRLSFAGNDRARTEWAAGGMAKIVTRRRGDILGAAILGRHAGELAHLWVLAIERRLRLKDIAAMLAPYPTLGEINKMAAAEFYKPVLFSRWTRRAVRALARLP